MNKFSYLNSIHHNGSSRYVSPPQPQLGDDITIRLRTAPLSPIRKVLLRISPDGEQKLIPLTPENLTPILACQWWQVSIRIEMPVTSYRFLIISDEAAYWYNGGGLHAYNPTDAEDFRILTGFQFPEWLRGAVFYQIFPDRFADGDPSNNVKDDEYKYIGFPAKSRRWGEPPTSWEPGCHG